MKHSPATSSRSRASRRPRPATRCAILRSRSSWSAWEFPEPVIELSGRTEDQRADQEKMGVALNRLAAEDPQLPRQHRPRIGPDDHQGDGRASPRHPGRSHEARVQGRSQCRRAAGCLSRIPRQAGRRRLHPQEAVGWFGVSSAASKVKVTPGEARARASSSKTRSRAANIPKEYIPAIEKGFREQAESGHLVGFPIIDFTVNLYDGAYHDVDLERDRVRNRRSRCNARSRRPCGHQAARADHEGRSRHARGLPRRRHRRSQLASWPDPGHRQPWQRPRRSTPSCRWRTCSVT